MKKYISILLSFIMIFNLSTPVLAASNVVSLPSTYQERSIIPLSDGSKNRLEILSSSDTNTHKLKAGEEFFIQEFKNNQLLHTVQGTYGGNTLGGKIGVAFPEPVAVEATYYTLTEYHSASNHYIAGHKGVERLVTTKKSNSYNKWFYEGYTPHNWKKSDDFATILWMSVFARPFAYVHAYR